MRRPVLAATLVLASCLSLGWNAAHAQRAANLSGRDRALYLREFDDAREIEALSRGEAVTAADSLRVFGDCVVRTAPSATRAFLSSAPVTPGETAALTALNPAFTKCISAEDQVQFTPGALQAVLAEAIYKRAVAQQGTAG